VSSGLGTTTLLKSIRSDTNGPSFGTGNPTVSNPGHGVQIGAPAKLTGNAAQAIQPGDGINVITKTITPMETVSSRTRRRIDVTGRRARLPLTWGAQSVGNKGTVSRTGGSTVNENDVFATRRRGSTSPAT
jgi:hypothetical protein